MSRTVYVILEPFDGRDGLEWCAVRAFHSLARAREYRRAEGILPSRPFPLVRLRIVRREADSASVRILDSQGLLQ